MDEKTKFLVLLGDNVRKLRISKSYSQQELADNLNFAKSTIQRIENGKLNPTIWALKHIASALEVDLDMLIR